MLARPSNGEQLQTVLRDMLPPSAGRQRQEKKVLMVLVFVVSKGGLRYGQIYVWGHVISISDLQEMSEVAG